MESQGESYSPVQILHPQPCPELYSWEPSGHLQTFISWFLRSLSVTSSYLSTFYCSYRFVLSNLLSRIVPYYIATFFQTGSVLDSLLSASTPLPQ